MDKEFFILYFVASDALLSGRLVPCKWNQAWRPSELYMCIEREKDNFKSREVNCLKECALALSNILNQNSIQSKIPTYFENKESQWIPFSYTSSVATKIFTKARLAASRLPYTFPELPILFLVWLRVSLCFMWPYSDRCSQYRTTFKATRYLRKGQK